MSRPVDQPVEPATAAADPSGGVVVDGRAAQDAERPLDPAQDAAARQHAVGDQDVADRQDAVGEGAGAGEAEWDEAEATRDWRWIEEWRAGREETPWAYGLGLAAFAALVALVGVIALTDSLAAQLWLAVIINVVVAAGIAPALWLCRGLPVLRWVAGGVALGLVLGWIGALAVVVPA